MADPITKQEPARRKNWRRCWRRWWLTLRACEAGGLAPRAAFDKIALAMASDADLFLSTRCCAPLVAYLRVWPRPAAAFEAGDILHLTAFTSERMMAKRDPW